MTCGPGRCKADRSIFSIRHLGTESRHFSCRVKKRVGCMDVSSTHDQAIDYAPCRYGGSRLWFRGPLAAASVVSYIHPGNRLATLVGFSGALPEGAGRDVAMQAAAMAPVALDESTIPQDLIDKELEIGKELAIQEGKPAEMADKIAQGRLKKWFKEATLVNQAYIKDNKQTVADFIGASAAGVTATGFCRAALD